VKRKLTKKQFKEKEQRIAKKKEAKKGVKELDMVIPRIPKISQSLIKSLAKYRNDEECGLVLEHIYIKGQWLHSSKAQELGNYFEYICTGGLPRDKHIPEPKLLKTGKPSIEYARMDKQKENFEAMMYEYGFEIEHTGYEFTNPKYSGIADIIAKDVNNKKQRVIVDIKTSGLLNDKWSPYGWADESIEEKWDLLLQAIHYKMLAKYEWGIEDIPFYFFVFSTKNDTDCKAFEIIVDESTRFQHLNNLSNIKTYLDSQLELGFKPKPKYSRCQNCGLADTCLHKVNVPIPQKVFI
jgi:CRISPR/Cas system-associated exonuclease Cas4 (RecB family)